MQNKNHKFFNKTILWLQVIWILLMWFYTLQINSSSTKWYTLRALQKERETLMSKEEELNLKISRAQNFDNLENNEDIKNMIAYSENWKNIFYLRKNSEFAKK